jgi:hypothetical protein
VVYGDSVGAPDPTIVTRVGPGSVRIKIFGSPNIVVVILNIVTKSLGQVSFTIIDPAIPRISGGSIKQLPVTRIGTVEDEFGGATLTNLKTRGVGINASASTVSHSQTDASFTLNVKSVKAFLFSCNSAFWSIDLKILLVTIKSRESYCRRAFGKTESDALIT